MTQIKHALVIFSITTVLLEFVELFVFRNHYNWDHRYVFSTRDSWRIIEDGLWTRTSMATRIEKGMSGSGNVRLEALRPPSSSSRKKGDPVGLFRYFTRFRKPVGLFVSRNRSRERSISKSSVSARKSVIAWAAPDNSETSGFQAPVSWTTM